MDAVIRALPQGCDTLCTDGMFSQGEWQLLSIARAAAADPAVLLLDEITANLGMPRPRARVLEALRRASVGRTVLSVSHRIYDKTSAGGSVEIRDAGAGMTLRGGEHAAQAACPLPFCLFSSVR